MATRRHHLSQAEVPFHGLARLVSFRVVGLGVHAPLPGRNNGLDALLLPLGAEGVAVIGPVGDQAGQRRVRPGFHQGPGLGAVVVLVPRHAQAQGTAASIRQNLGAEAASAAARADPFLCFGARRARARPCCPARTDPDRPAGRPSDAARRPSRIRAPSGDRPNSTGRTRSATDAKGPLRAIHPAHRFHKKATMSFLAHAYIGTGN